MDELFGEPVKKEGRSKTPLWQRRPNPVCPSLPQRSKRKPQRVLLSYLPRKTGETIGQKGTSGNTECKEERSGAE